MSITKSGITVTIYNSNYTEISSAQLGETIHICIHSTSSLYSWDCGINGGNNETYYPSEEADTHDIDYTWTIPTNIITNAMSATYEIYAAGTAVSGGIFIEEFHIPFRITVPEYTLASPVVSVKSSLQRDGESLYYNDISYAIANFTWPQGKYGSRVFQNIRYYDVVSGYNGRLEDTVIVDGHTIEAITTGYPGYGYGEKSIIATATDSRGKTSQATVTFNEEFYYPVEVLEFNVFRCTANGVADEENGTCLSYSISFTQTGDNDLVEQGIAITLNWKKTSDTSYSSINIPRQVGGGNDLTGIIDEFSFSPEHNYYVYAQVTDSFTTTTSAVKTVAAYGVLLDFRADGKGFSVGKIATTQADPLFEVAWPSRFYDTAVFQKGDGWIGPRSVRSIDGANYRAEMGVGAGKSAALEFAPVGDSVKNRIDLFADRTELYQPLLANSGGTGRKSLTSGYFLRGNGTGAVTLSSPSDSLLSMGGAWGGDGYVSDLNTCYYRGLYACNTSTLNTPIYEYGVCISIPYRPNSLAVNDCKQLFIAHGQNMRIYQRTCNNKTWSAWTTNYGSSYQQEVGTWTPSLYFPNADMGTLSYTRWGYYVKTGRSITISWVLRFTTTSQGWLQQEDYPRIAGIPYLPYGGHCSSPGQTVIIPGRGRTDQTVNFIAYADNYRLGIQEQNGMNVSMKPSYIGDFWLDGSITYIGY